MSVDVDFRAFLLADSEVAAITQTVALNHVPAADEAPYVWFGRTSSRDETDLGGEGGLVDTTFAVECVATEIAVAVALGEAVRQRCNGWRGVMNSATRVQGMFVEDAADDYVLRSAFEDESVDVVALEVQVIHE